MKHFVYILFLPLLAACSAEEPSAPEGSEGTLVIGDLVRSEAKATIVTTRNTIDADLAVEILAADGQVYRGYSFAAGAEVPDKFSLIPGTYTLHAYSENADTWQGDNEGRGSAVYDIRQAFEIQAEWTTYVDVCAPMTNYGVMYTLPEGFATWFPTSDFTITADGRTCSLTPGQAAYFDPANAEGFTFTLHLVNTDGETYDLTAVTYANPQEGLLYNINYTFASDDDPTKLKIGISYDDTYEELVSELTLY